MDTEEQSKQVQDVDAWLRLPWHEQVFHTQDAVQQGPFFGPASGSDASDRGTIIPGGWVHEHCDICVKTISDSPGKESVGFTNGEEWLCRGCYAQYVTGNQEAAQQADLKENP